MIDQNSCGALIKQIHDGLEKNANNAMHSHDITMVQCSALLILNGASEKQMTLKELERSLRVAQSTAAGIVTRLEQKGLVEGVEVRMTNALKWCASHSREWNAVIARNRKWSRLKNRYCPD